MGAHRTGQPLGRRSDEVAGTGSLTEMFCEVGLGSVPFSTVNSPGARGQSGRCLRERPRITWHSGASAARFLRCPPVAQRCYGLGRPPWTRTRRRPLGAHDIFGTDSPANLRQGSGQRLSRTGYPTGSGSVNEGIGLA